VQLKSGFGDQSYALTTGGRLLYEASRRAKAAELTADSPAIAALLEGIPAVLRDHEDVLRCAMLTVQLQNAARPAERFPGELAHLRNKVRDLIALSATANEEPASTLALLKPVIGPIGEPGPLGPVDIGLTVGYPPEWGVQGTKGPDDSALAHATFDYARHVANGGHTLSLPEPSHAHHMNVDPNGGHSCAIYETDPNAHHLHMHVDPNAGHSFALNGIAYAHTHALEHADQAHIELDAEIRQNGRVLAHGVTLRARIYADGSMVIDNPERPLVVYPAAHVGAHALEPLTTTLEPAQSDEVLARIEKWTKEGR
jgi:hypothetical protein